MIGVAVAGAAESNDRNGVRTKFVYHSAARNTNTPTGPHRHDSHDWSTVLFDCRFIAFR
jgi:hypothetical protein